MNTSSVFMSLETRSIESLSNKQIKQVGDAAIRLPSNFQTNISQNSTVSLRVCSLFLSIESWFFFSQKWNP